MFFNLHKFLYVQIGERTYVRNVWETTLSYIRVVCAIKKFEWKIKKHLNALWFKRWLWNDFIYCLLLERYGACVDWQCWFKGCLKVILGIYVLSNCIFYLIYVNNLINFVIVLVCGSVFIWLQISFICSFFHLLITTNITYAFK